VTFGHWYPAGRNGRPEKKAVLYGIAFLLNAIGFIFPDHNNSSAHAFRNASEAAVEHLLAR